MITLEAHAWTRYKEGGNTWTDIPYILSDFKNTGLGMSSHYKRVEIKDILNSVTSESSEGTNSQKPTDEALHSKKKKEVSKIIPKWIWAILIFSHRLLSPTIRPSNSASTSKVHYCPMNHCSENQSTRRKLDSHFLEAHMSDTRWGTQPGIAGVTTFVSPMFLTNRKKLCWWVSGMYWGYYFDVFNDSV